MLYTVLLVAYIQQDTIVLDELVVYLFVIVDFEVTLTVRGPCITSGSLPNFFTWCLLLDTAAFLQPSQLLSMYVIEVP